MRSRSDRIAAETVLWLIFIAVIVAIAVSGGG